MFQVGLRLKQVEIETDFFFTIFVIDEGRLCGRQMGSPCHGGQIAWLCLRFIVSYWVSFLLGLIPAKGSGWTRWTSKHLLELWFSEFGISCLPWRTMHMARSRVYYLKSYKCPAVSSSTEEKEQKQGEEWFRWGVNGQVEVWWNYTY